MNRDGTEKRSLSLPPIQKEGETEPKQVWKRGLIQDEYLSILPTRHEWTTEKNANATGFCR